MKDQLLTHKTQKGCGFFRALKLASALLKFLAVFVQNFNVNHFAAIQTVGCTGNSGIVGSHGHLHLV